MISVNSRKIENKNGRIYYFDNLKMILILLVVFGHFIEKSKSDIARSAFLFIYSFHMPLFIFISGYFSRKSIDKKDKNKIINFFSLYLILKIIFFIIDKFIYKREISFSLFTTDWLEWYLFAMGSWYLISILLKDVNKKYILIFNIILSLIIGYDKCIGDLYCLSRIIVFYPFFVLGSIISKERMWKFTNNKVMKYIAAIFFFAIIVLYIRYIKDIEVIRLILTGKNSYYKLKQNMIDYGILLRSISYIISLTIGAAFMILVPKGKTFFSEFGSRSLTVYFLHGIIIKIFEYESISLRVYQYLITSVIVTFVFSLKWFSIPLDKFIKLNKLIKFNNTN